MVVVVLPRSRAAKDNNWLPPIADLCRLAVTYGPANIQAKLGLDGLAFEISSRPAEAGAWALTVHCAALADQNMALLSDALGLAIQSQTVNVERRWSGQRGRFLYAATTTEPIQPERWEDVAVAATWVLITHHTPAYTEPRSIALSIGREEPQTFTVARGFIDTGLAEYTEVRITGSSVTAATHGDSAQRIEDTVVEKYVATGQLVNFRPWPSHDPAVIQFQFCKQLASGRWTTTAHSRYPER